MLRRVWSSKLSGSKNARLEEHIYRDGSLHYSLINRLGSASDVEPNEIPRIMKMWRMEETTEEFRAAGWISPLV